MSYIDTHSLPKTRSHQHAIAYLRGTLQVSTSPSDLQMLVVRAEYGIGDDGKWKEDGGRTEKEGGGCLL